MFSVASSDLMCGEMTFNGDQNLYYSEKEILQFSEWTPQSKMHLRRFGTRVHFTLHMKDKGTEECIGRNMDLVIYRKCQIECILYYFII